MINGGAPACSRAFFGSVNSDCSNPLVTRIATFIPDNEPAILYLHWYFSETGASVMPSRPAPMSSSPPFCLKNRPITRIIVDQSVASLNQQRHRTVASRLLDTVHIKKISLSKGREYGRHCL